MRPVNTSDNSSRHQAALNESTAEDDTMLMGFEFFDQTGRLNPRKILFTEKTCPNKTQRVLSHLFGRIMKWNASRWAENFLKNTQINQAALPENKKQQVTSLLHDIRTTGVVSMPRLFSFVASFAQEPKASDQDDQQITRPGSSSRIGPSSAPFLINHEEITQTFHLQTSKNDRSEVSASAKIANDTTADNTHLFEACQIIETQWEELSKINDGNLAPPQFKLPVRSGFLDYCRQTSIKPTAEQAIEQIRWRNDFIDMNENDWSRYQNLMTGPQYQAWTSKRHEWIALLSKRAQSPSEKQTPERNLRLELKTERPVLNTEGEPTVAEAFSRYSADFEAASHGRGLLPLPVQEIIDSDFITYCDVGVEALKHIDINTLEEFLKKYQNKWDIFGKILPPSQFAQLKKHRDQVDQDITDFRANHSSTVNSSTEKISTEEDLAQTDTKDTQQDTSDAAGVFSEATVISLEHVNKIEWDAINLHRKIKLDDAKKLRDYFSSADINRENLDICKKIDQISRKIRESKASEKPAFGVDGESNSPSDLQNPGDVLAGIYGNYLRRYASASQAKSTTSGDKKSPEKIKSSKKSKSSKKPKSTLKPKPIKHIKPGKKQLPENQLKNNSSARQKHWLRRRGIKSRKRMI